MVNAPPSYPIADAPAQEGQPFGPLLIWPGDEERNWRIGRWTGMEWANDDEEIVAPTRYSPLPLLPAD